MAKFFDAVPIDPEDTFYPRRIRASHISYMEVERRVYPVVSCFSIEEQRTPNYYVLAYIKGIGDFVVASGHRCKEEAVAWMKQNFK
jgi:hypothetical protein